MADVAKRTPHPKPGGRKRPAAAASLNTPTAGHVAKKANTADAPVGGRASFATASAAAVRARSASGATKPKRPDVNKPAEVWSDDRLSRVVVDIKPASPGSFASALADILIEGENTVLPLLAATPPLTTKFPHVHGHGDKFEKATGLDIEHWKFQLDLWEGIVPPGLTPTQAARFSADAKEFFDRAEAAELAVLYALFKYDKSPDDKNYVAVIGDRISKAYESARSALSRSRRCLLDEIEDDDPELFNLAWEEFLAAKGRACMVRPAEDNRGRRIYLKCRAFQKPGTKVGKSTKIVEDPLKWLAGTKDPVLVETRDRLVGLLKPTTEGKPRLRQCVIRDSDGSVMAGSDNPFDPVWVWGNCVVRAKMYPRLYFKGTEFGVTADMLPDITRVKEVPMSAADGLKSDVDWADPAGSATATSAAELAAAEEARKAAAGNDDGADEGAVYGRSDTPAPMQQEDPHAEYDDEDPDAGYGEGEVDDYAGYADDQYD